MLLYETKILNNINVTYIYTYIIFLKNLDAKMLLFLPLFLKFHNSKTRSTTLLFYVAVILIFDFCDNSSNLILLLINGRMV